MDLSYNCLSALPSFSATAKKKLKILLLAGNKIMDLTGECCCLFVLFLNTCPGFVQVM